MTGPQARCIILREVAPSKCELLFYTDFRSGKVQDINHNPKVCLLFWNGRSQEQLRLQGIARLHHGGALVQEHWAKLPPYAIKDYASLSAPGQEIWSTEIMQTINQMDHDPFADADTVSPELAVSQSGTPAFSEDAMAQAKRNFCLVSVQIHQMDYLQLSRSGHRRFQANRLPGSQAEPSAPEQWAISELVP